MERIPETPVYRRPGLSQRFLRTPGVTQIGSYILRLPRLPSHRPEAPAGQSGTAAVWLEYPSQSSFRWACPVRRRSVTEGPRSRERKDSGPEMAAVLFSILLAEANQNYNNQNNSNLCVCVHTDVCTVKSLNMCFPLIELILKSTFHSTLTMINNNNPTQQM